MMTIRAEGIRPAFHTPYTTARGTCLGAEQLLHLSPKRQALTHTRDKAKRTS